MSEPTDVRSRDILAHSQTAAVIFWLPIAAIIVAGLFNIGSGWRTSIWVSALGVMSAGCIANAMRCGRIHCFLTGPFFIVMAVASLLYGVGIVALGPNGWNILASILLIGAVVLCTVPEIVFGRYMNRPPPRG